MKKTDTLKSSKNSKNSTKKWSKTYKTPFPSTKRKTGIFNKKIET